MNFHGWLGFVIAVIVLGGGMLWLWHDKQEKASEVATKARERGWRYQLKKTDLWSRIAGFAFIVGLRSRLSQTEHMLAGTHRGFRFSACEQTVRYSGPAANDGGSTYQEVHVHVLGDSVALMLDARPSGGLFTGFADRIGRHGLEKAPEGDMADGAFATRFRVRSNDGSFAHAVFGDSLRKWLLEDERAANWPVVVRDGTASSEARRSLDFDDVVARLDFLVDFLERVPDTAWSVGSDKR